MRSTPSRGDTSLDRREDPAQLPVPPLEVGGQAVVAVREPGELVVAGDPDRGRQVARRGAVDGRGDRPQRRGQLGREQPGERGCATIAATTSDEQQDTTERRADRGPAAPNQDDDPRRTRQRDAAKPRRGRSSGAPGTTGSGRAQLRASRRPPDPSTSARLAGRRPDRSRPPGCSPGESPTSR